MTQKRYSGGFGDWHSEQMAAGAAGGGVGRAGDAASEGRGTAGSARGGSGDGSGEAWGANENTGAAGRARLPAEAGPDGELPRFEAGEASSRGFGGGAPIVEASAPIGAGVGREGSPSAGVGRLPRGSAPP